MGEIIEEKDQVPTYISVRYAVENQIEISALEEKHGFKWSDVKEWWIKYDRLSIKLTSGDVQTYTMDSGEEHVDWKYPAYACLFDQDEDEIEEDEREFEW